VNPLRLAFVVLAVALASLVLAASASAENLLEGFDVGYQADAGETPATQAGSHPYAQSTHIVFVNKPDPELGLPGIENSVTDPKDTEVKLPPGFVGNPLAIPDSQSCKFAEFLNQARCPDSSAVGIAHTRFLGDFSQWNASVFKLVTPPGRPALFAFKIGTAMTLLDFSVRPDDYGISVRVLDIPQIIALKGIDVTIWGVPADPSHDPLRGADCLNPLDGSSMGTCPSSGPLKPLLTLPTFCGVPASSHLSLNTWQTPDVFEAADSASAPEFQGCNKLPFSPQITLRPGSRAHSPTGLDVDLELPQNEDPSGLATATLKDAKVTLPAGLSINPSSANGLVACTKEQFGFRTASPVTCPDASKIGQARIDSPLLPDPLQGGVYVAEPHRNEFGTLLAIYVLAHDDVSGVTIKLAGKVEADPVTGQLTATFPDNPPQPFERFHLEFFDGARAALTSADCGTYTSQAHFVPASFPDAPAVDRSDSFQIDSNCQSDFAPSFDSGAVNPIAGAHSPFVLHLRRNEETQRFSALNVKPPPGLIARLAGTPICPEAALAAAAAKSGAQELANPSCPAASEVGTVSVGVGSGPSPYYAQGKAYLAGPYKGAPLSAAVITPAVAGPYDLGTVVVKTPIYVDPKTAEVTATTDPLPQILQGIPLDVRSIDVSLDKPDFTINPTSCEPMAVSGQAFSALAQSADLSSRFQLGECARLGFKPKLSLRLKGGTKRGKYPQLTAVLKTRPGDANIASVSVAFPRSEFIANEHFRTICTRVQFAADSCPTKAVYGTATVSTPLLDGPLSGNVYLRSSDNELPDLVPDLRGPAAQPLKLEVAGRTDSVNGGIRNTFDFVPDAPFSKAVFKLQGGAKGLFVNSRNLCAGTFRATVKYTAHNGDRLTAHPVVKAADCKGGHGKARHAHR
jgi:hypothetical protein